MTYGKIFPFIRSFYGSNGHFFVSLYSYFKYFYCTNLSPEIEHEMSGYEETKCQLIFVCLFVCLWNNMSHLQHTVNQRFLKSELRGK